MDISVIIVSWNVRELLAKCLESIFRYTQTKENTPTIGVSSWNSAESVSFNSEANHLADNIAQRNNLSSATQMDGTGIEPAFLEVVSPRAYQLAEPPTRAANDIISQFEVIVVDNASSDGTREMLKESFNVIPAKGPPSTRSGAGIQKDGSPIKSGMTIRLIQNETNNGFAAANNQGIKEAKGEFILLLNPDTEFIEDTLSKVVEKMRLDPSIGVLGCRFLNPDGSVQPSVRRFPRVRDILVMLFKLHKVWPGLLDRYLAKDFDYDSLPSHPPYPPSERGGFSVDQVMGAFFCVRRELFAKIGLLDEGYFIWFEEVDFCRRAQAAGYKVVYWPGTSIIHHGGQSFSQQMTWKKQWWFFKSAWRYFTKSR